MQEDEVNREEETYKVSQEGKVKQIVPKSKSIKRLKSELQKPYFTYDFCLIKLRRNCKAFVSKTDMMH